MFDMCLLKHMQFQQQNIFAVKCSTNKEKKYKAKLNVYEANILDIKSWVNK